ncbi:PaaI family thioesterase [Williamsia deligens]|uniref:PaaI family thioesterase n=1 Tax=Williamsia deligens TaxID=321325 RepID=A0ABW3GBK9_9NOCA|nr:PaaI family thioesterase [Williamsia deligens]MCP2196070.1 putative domain 1-containing protein [Williamsia deligens]
MSDAIDDSLIGAGLDGELGFRYDVVSGDGSRASFTVAPGHHQPFGIVHGGVHCALVESLASMSAAQWLADQGLPPRVVGVNNSTDFLRAVSEGEVTGQAVPIHRGRSQQLWQVDITDGDGRLIAQGRVRLQNLDQPAR